jgi:hypothetical protein
MLIPWVLSGLVDRAKGNTYWLKEIDILGYLQHGMSYPTIINLGLILLTLFSVIIVISKRKSDDYFLIVIPLFVVILPILFSYIKFPILVPRYGIVMMPYIFLLIGVGLFEVRKMSKKLSDLILTIFIVVVSLPGIYATFLKPAWFEKSHWREAALNISTHPLSKSNEKWVIYSPTSGINQFAAIDYYLSYNNPTSKIIDDFMIGVEKYVVLVEVESYYKIDDKKFSAIENVYNVNTIEIGSGQNKVYVHYCTMK